MIPAEAVEAATDAMQQFSLLEDRDGLQSWEAYAKLALEAAAPHLLAEVATDEELDALPVGSVVLSHAYRHYSSGERISFQRNVDGNWYRGARSSDTHPDNFLPVTVLHRTTSAN